MTKNCGNKKKELTLVTLQSTSFLGTKGPKVSLLLKKMNGFNAMITGLPELEDFGAKCIPFKHKNCLFPCKFKSLRVLTKLTHFKFMSAQCRAIMIYPVWLIRSPINHSVTDNKIHRTMRLLNHF